jgi:signal transduction histidine kinase
MSRWSSRAVDGAVAAVLAAGQLVESAVEFRTGRWDGPVTLLVTASAVALYWRRSRPVPVALLAAVALAAPVLVGPSVETLTTGLVLLVAGYSLAAYGRRPRDWVLPLVALVAAGLIRSVTDWGYDPYTVITGFVYVAIAFGLGLLVRHQRGRVDHAERHREEHAAAAVAAERARIARDLHDVVAHAISVIVLQARGGRRMLTVDPAEARTAFDAVEQVAGQAMVEMRRLLEVLRAADAGPADLTPRPSLAHLPELIDRLGGPPVTLTMTGDVAGLPPGVDLTAYRIVQEALTNVLRHASAHSVALTVAVPGGALDVDVTDDGRGGPAVVGGVGLLGMRERAAVYGGTVSAGPAPAGGFRVCASLPLARVLS